MAKAKSLKILKGVHHDGRMYLPGDEDALQEAGLDKDATTRLQEAGALEFPDGEIVADEADPTVSASMKSPRRDRKGKAAVEITNTVIDGDGGDANPPDQE